ncbi:MAG: ParB/RepB/Spo0J family partition protein [Verrucomicrobiales bacterium]
MAKQALGKGLGALIKSKHDDDASRMRPGEAVIKTPIDKLTPSPLQPRGRFNEEYLSELMESIRQHGVIQPLIARRVGDKLELIAGERRWRASKKLGLAEVPVIEREASDQEVLEMALIENLQRQDLDPIEEATGYVRLAKEFAMKQDEIANRVGKSRASVANAMRLLELAEPVRKYVAERQLSVGHAKALLGIKDKAEQAAATEHVLKKGFNVRATEKFVKQYNEEGGLKPVKPGTGSAKGGSSQPELSAHLGQIQNKLREQFATHVTLVHHPKKGKIELEYYGEDDLQRLLDLLGFEMD